MFRGKRVDNGEWVYGCLLIDGITGKYFIHMSGNCLNESDKVGQEGCLMFVAFEVDPETVCQYTGRECYSEKDDDLHKIFEGDIFDVTTFDHNGHDYHHICKVEWISGGFALVSEKEDFFMWLGEVEDTESDLLLLGNIFDTPDLLTASSTDSD